LDAVCDAVEASLGLGDEAGAAAPAAVDQRGRLDVVDEKGAPWPAGANPEMLAPLY
jgi:hypothetical protein